MNEYTEKVIYTETAVKPETAVKTLRNTCDTIKEILNKANNMAECIVGEPPSTARGFEDPASTLEALANELAIIQDMAQSTLDYWSKINEII